MLASSLSSTSSRERHSSLSDDLVVFVFVRRFLCKCHKRKVVSRIQVRLMLIILLLNVIILCSAIITALTRVSIY